MLGLVDAVHRSAARRGVRYESETPWKAVSATIFMCEPPNRSHGTTRIRLPWQASDPRMVCIPDPVPLIFDFRRSGVFFVFSFFSYGVPDVGIEPTDGERMLSREKSIQPFPAWAGQGSSACRAPSGGSVTGPSSGSLKCFSGARRRGFRRELRNSPRSGPSPRR